MDSRSIISAIDAEIAKLEQVRSLLANGGKVDGVTTRKTAKNVSAEQPKKRTMSAEARKGIGDAQRKRWAATKKQAPAAPSKATKTVKKTSPVKTKAAPKKAVKRTMSPEARKRMADAQRKRWAAAKKAAKKTVPKKAAKAVPSVAMPEAPKVEAAS